MSDWGTSRKASGLMKMEVSLRPQFFQRTELSLQHLTKRWSRVSVSSQEGSEGPNWVVYRIQASIPPSYVREQVNPT